MVLGTPDGALLAAQDMGHFGVKMKRSRDGGATWDDRPAPKYPPKPEGVEDIDPTRRTPVPWDNKRVWALEASPRSGDLWCGTIPGALFRSKDGGESWQHRRIALEPSRAQRLVRRRRRLSRHPFGADRSTRRTDYPDRRVVRRALDEPRRRRILDAARAAACGRRSCRRIRRSTPQFQDPHRIVQCAARPRSDLDPASQRHLQQRRRRREAAPRSRLRSRPASASRSRCIPRIPTPRGSCPA